MSDYLSPKLHSHAPLHVREGMGGPWRHWFAWRPVRLEQGGWAWLRRIYRRRFWPASWFCPQWTYAGWNEYSATGRGFWEVA